MKDLILGFKLLRYGYKLKTNVMMLGLFTAIGLVMKYHHMERIFWAVFTLCLLECLPIR